MSIDDKVKNAIYSVVERNHQPEKVAEKIIQWFNDLSESNTSLENPAEVNPYLENILDALVGDRTLEDEW